MRKGVFVLLVIFLLPMVLAEEKIWVVGDSLSLNYDGEGYPPQLDRLMKTNSSGFNLALSGVKCDYVIESEIPKINKGDYAIVLCGTNDLYQGENPSQVIQDLKEIYSLLATKKITPIFLTISPNEPVEDCNKILEVNRGIKQFTSERNIILIDTYNVLTNGTSCHLNKQLYQDYVHLNKDGNAIVAKLILEKAFNKTVYLNDLVEEKPNFLKLIFNRLRFYS
jgi:lysophospholipase L1-like esterase